MMKTVNTQQPVIRQVAIVGSGLAGLTAARRLQEAGTEVTVFEKSRGPGGRLAAKRVTGGSADIGAQYFTIRNPRFREFLHQHAGEDVFAPWQGRLVYETGTGATEPFHSALRYVGVPRMTAISRALAEGLALHAGVRIARMDRDSAGSWTLTDTAGEMFGPFDGVIVTAPPAQAYDLLHDSELSGLAAAIEPHLAGMQACWTVVAHYPGSLGLGYQGVQSRDPVLGWAANNSSKPGRDGDGEWWVLHGTPEWSHQNRDLSGEDVTRQLLTAFTRVCGVSAEPDELVSHRWLYARSVTAAGPGHLTDHRLAVGIVGDWLQGGRVEGAFDSAESLIRDWREAGLVTR